ncbi:hypothetical protein [Alkaliphilus peptidifermentans]|uniref:Uncharacterized protein n=1 Tax=Alkaliphilus peptidifermentans DSM 18978 TaxID=1120976 RepID=A0A1G5J411_9FIRM|nr:hypothetical protein [Alkaliphilus peptidifermentans]SCY83083.1 hypothetical protein SAMN03080606_02666 [Alkaliphilus peptidifermentans DSM 18978]
MSDHHSRIYKIINELTNFILKSGARHCDIKLEEENESIKLTIAGYSIDLSPEELEELQNSLSIPRQQPVEEYLWELAGENENYEELNLIGMMIDSASVKYKDRCLTIIITRNEGDGA